MYTLQYKKAVAKELKKLPQKTRTTIVGKILALSKNPQPHGAVKLQGSTNIYRIRHSGYRVVYSVNNNELIILVIRVAHRREVSRDM